MRGRPKRLHPKAVIHFVADVYRPLRVGFVHDKAGDDMAGEFFYNRKSLHGVWDPFE